MANNIKVTYNGDTLSLPQGTTVEEAKDTLANFHPEVRNAEGVVDADGNIELRVVSGTKGSDSVLVVYGDTEISFPAGTTPEEARDALSNVHSEVANASYEQDGNTIRFFVESGKKGR